MLHIKGTFCVVGALLTNAQKLKNVQKRAKCTEKDTKIKMNETEYSKISTERVVLNYGDMWFMSMPMWNVFSLLLTQLQLLRSSLKSQHLSFFLPPLPIYLTYAIYAAGLLAYRLHKNTRALVLYILFSCTVTTWSKKMIYSFVNKTAHQINWLHICNRNKYLCFRLCEQVVCVLVSLASKPLGERKAETRRRDERRGLR